MILITCAVGKELAFFAGEPHVELLVTGIGPVEAAASVARALAQSRYDLVINAGIAGAFGGGPKIGAGVIVSEECIELGLETGEPLLLPDRARTIDRVTSDLRFVDLAVERGVSAVRGLTVSAVTATDATAARLAKLDVQIESMEGFAVLRAAEMAGVSAIEVRGISNYVGDRSRSKWNFEDGVRGLERVLTVVLALSVDLG
ncbi:MAG: futalosine hydrolase [Candidatus Eremiobacteraeota bacterium]|nr:futalosine hydrolase [Candidatus Eremiobacteraeota bacterium]